MKIKVLALLIFLFAPIGRLLAQDAETSANGSAMLIAPNSSAPPASSFLQQSGESSGEKKKDRIAQLDSAMKWFRRGAATVDVITTWRMLSVPNYSGGGSFVINNTYYNISEFWVPAERGFGTLSGSRNEAAVAAYIIGGHITTEILFNKLFRHLSGRSDRWRHLRILIPVGRGVLAAYQIKFAVQNERGRNLYLQNLRHHGLPTDHVPPPAPY